MTCTACKEYYIALCKIFIGTILGKELGKDITIDSLKSAGFESVFVAIGAGKQRKSDIVGAEKAIDAVEFLKSLSLGNTVTVKENVVVIGKGFAAMDAARSAVRLGAKQVTLLQSGNFSKRSADAQAQKEAKEELEALEIEYGPLDGVKQSEIPSTEEDSAEIIAEEHE